MDFKKYLRPAIGIAAFVIGGIIAQEKAFDALEVVGKHFNPDPKDR